MFWATVVEGVWVVSCVTVAAADLVSWVCFCSAAGVVGASGMMAAAGVGVCSWMIAGAGAAAGGVKLFLTLKRSAREKPEPKSALTRFRSSLLTVPSSLMSPGVGGVNAAVPGVGVAAFQEFALLPKAFVCVLFSEFPEPLASAHAWASL